MANLMNRKEPIIAGVHGLCCFGIMKLETGAFLVVYIDFSCLIGLLAYLTACIMIYCCSLYDFLWFLLCTFQSILCLLLFRAIKNRLLFLLKLYLLFGIIGRTIILAVWILIILINGIANNKPLTDGQLIFLAFLFICFVVNILCGLFLLRCHSYYKRLHKERARVKKIRHLNLCPHLDYKCREDVGLLPKNNQFLLQTANEKGFLLHELDLTKLQKSVNCKLKS